MQVDFVCTWVFFYFKLSLICCMKLHHSESSQIQWQFNLREPAQPFPSSYPLRSVTIYIKKNEIILSLFFTDAQSIRCITLNLTKQCMIIICRTVYIKKERIVNRSTVAVMQTNGFQWWIIPQNGCTIFKDPRFHLFLYVCVCAWVASSFRIVHHSVWTMWLNASV